MKLKNNRLYKKNREVFLKYQENPQYYKEKLKGILREDQLRLAFMYLDENLSLSELGMRENSSKAWIGTIVGKVFTIIKNENSGLNYGIRISSRHRKLKQEEFDLIKKLSFEGHSVVEIIEIIKRSKDVIVKARAAQTLEEYFAKSNEYHRKNFERKKNMNNNPIEQYAKKLDSVLPKQPKETVIKKMLEPPFDDRDARDRLLELEHKWWELVQDYIEEEVKLRMKEKLRKILEE